ncbi:unnamed protein product [Cylicocyclus nassatus]|uniref:Uncharacterized protein n=1 Tax=Cylicocyclus nassatus TaxID=53992 RepID=A0AA36GZ81_CYLNA|nr:unnamed protein product [Cylicocyclus nassatus]
MDADMISAALRLRAQVIASKELLVREENAVGPSDHYSDLHRDALSSALKEEQLVEDLLAKRQEQLDRIRALSAQIDPAKLQRAKELLQEKQELVKKRDELQALLKEKNLTLSDIQARKGRITDHDAKLSHLRELAEDREQLQSYMKSTSKKISAS